MQKSTLNQTKQQKMKSTKIGTNKNMFKEQNTNKNSLLNYEKSKNRQSIKIKEVKQEEDYSKKIEKLKTILEKKNRVKLNRKKTFISDSKYKLIVGLFGIALVKINFNKLGYWNDSSHVKFNNYSIGIKKEYKE